jgi:hypothetical protein
MNSSNIYAEVINLTRHPAPLLKVRMPSQLQTFKVQLA